MLNIKRDHKHLIETTPLLIDLFEISETHLSSIALLGVKVDNNQLSSILEKQKNIEILTIIDCKGMDVGEIPKHIKNFTKLKELEIISCPGNINLFINKLSQKKNLTKTIVKLEIAIPIVELDENYFHENIGKFKNLESLNIAHCYNIGTKKIEPLKYLQHLTALDITGCRATNEKIDLIVKNIKQLEKIILSDNQMLTNKSLESIGEYAEKLRWLDLTNCNKITFEICRTGFENVRHLNVSECTRLTDNGIHFISNNMKKLTRLIAKKCTEITDKSLIHINRCAKNLKFLNLSYTMISFNKILEGEEKIQSLNNIKELKIKNCKNIKAVIIFDVLEKLKNIEKIIFNQSSGVDEDIIRYSQGTHLKKKYFS